MLGDLEVGQGRLNVGTDDSTNSVSFEIAHVASGATLYIAKGATLTIRVPHDLFNAGNLINDGTVIDDLANTGAFNNNSVYVANVTSNTGTINNNIPGVWTGNVESNGGSITNNAGATWNGHVETNIGGISNAGTWVGTVVSNIGFIGNYASWTGDIQMNTYGSIHNSGAGAVWTGNVNNNTQVLNISGARWNGDVVANNNAVFNLGGSTWSGRVVANGGGENGLAQIDNYGRWINGTVETNAGWIFNMAESWTGDVLSNTNGIFNNHIDVNTNPTGGNHAVWNGDIYSNGDLILNDRGGFWNGRVLGNGGTVANQAGSTWTGNVEANTGLVRNRGTWTGDVASNAGTISSNGVWNGAFSSRGIVNAENQINGAFANSGLLQVTGSLSGITALSNSGTLELRGGGAVQTLSVSTADFAATSTYGIDVDGAGGSDRTLIAGVATLGGMVAVVAAEGASGNTAATYTILTAGSLSGSFASVTTDLAFLAPRLSYDLSNVYLAFQRNDVGFAFAGTTANQRATAGGVESLGTGTALFDNVLWLEGPEAAAAFNALSGEAHASGKSAALLGAGVLVDSLTDRVNQSFDALATSTSVNAYAGDMTLPQAEAERGAWGQLYGQRGSIAANTGAATLDWSLGGFNGGLDGLVGDWRLGVMMQAGLSGTAVPTLASTSSSNDYGGGLYAGREWGNTRLSFGSTYTWHDSRSVRQVDFRGVSETLTADYSSATAQVFGTLSHEIDLGAVSLTPFGSVAYVGHSTDGFTETGGTAALSSAANLVDATFTTLGLGVERKFVVAGDMLLTASASAGWRRAYASDPTASNGFEGGNDFTVSGGSVRGDSLVLKAGLNLETGESGVLALSYAGQFGNVGQSQAVKASWSGQF